MVRNIIIFICDCCTFSYSIEDTDLEKPLQHIKNMGWTTITLDKVYHFCDVCAPHYTFYYVCERCGGTGEQEDGMPCPPGWNFSDKAGICDRCKGEGKLGNYNSVVSLTAETTCNHSN